MGVIYERQENFPKSIEYFKECVLKDELYSEAWYELGYCYENSDQLENALIAYDKFIEIEPYNATGWYNRGIVQIRIGEMEKAIGSFELAVAIKEWLTVTTTSPGLTPTVRSAK